MENNNNIIEEVDNDIFAEKVSSIWSKYSKYIIIGIVIIACGIGINEFVNYRTEVSSQEGNYRILGALNLVKNGDYNEAIAELKGVAKNYSGNIATMARINEANILLQQNNYNEALAIWESIIKDKSSEKFLIPMLEVLTVYTAIDANNIKTADKYATSLLEKAKSKNAAKVYLTTALELNGVVAMINKDYKKSYMFLNEAMDTGILTVNQIGRINAYLAYVTAFI